MASGLGGGFLDAQGQRRGCRLGQWLGQARSDAEQVGLDHQIGLVMLDIDAGLPRRAAGQAVTRWQPEMLEQLADVRGAADLHGDAVAMTLDGDPDRPAEYPAADLRRRDAGLGQQQPTIDLGQRRQAFEQMDLVVLEAEIAAQPGFLDTAQRNVERQVELAVAGDFHAPGEVVDHLADRAFVDEIQELPGRPAGITADEQHFFLRLEVGNFDHDIRQTSAEYRAFLGDDPHAGAEAHVGLDLVDHRPAGRIVQFHALGLGRDQELALGRVAEREIREIALEHHLAVVTATGDDAAA